MRDARLPKARHEHSSFVLSGVQKLIAPAASRFFAISEATFDVEAGELVSLVGPLGSGKTHAARDPRRDSIYDAGELSIGSAAQTFDPSRDIGMVFGSLCC